MRINIQRLLLLIITIIVPLSLFLPTPGWNQPTQTIRIAGDQNFPPFEYRTEAGVYSGFNVDVLNAISIETGVKFEFYPMPWNQAIQALHDGKVDAIQGMKYSAGRDQIYDFSDPYFTSTQAIFVRKDNMYIRNLDNLDNSTVVVQKGDIAQDLLKKNEQIKLIQVQSQQQAIQYLYEKKANAFVGNRISGQYFIQKSHHQEDIKIVGEPLYPESYGVAVLPKNREILSVINEGLQTIKRENTYNKIEEKWFGEYIKPAHYSIESFLFIFKIVVGITLIVITGFLWWNRVLKKEVNNRTKQISQMNQQLQEKMELLEQNVFFQQQILDSAYSSFITLSDKGYVTMINQRAENFFQLTEPILTEHYQQTPIHSLFPEEEIQESLLYNRVFFQQETTWKQAKKDGIILYSIYPITTRTGENVGVVLNFNDITHRRRLEQKMAESNRLRALGQMMMGIAHEIRNPLTSIMTYTQLLPKKMDNQEFRQFFSKHVTSEITRLNSLINDLLDYARPKKSSPSRFSIEYMIQTILTLVNQKLDEKNVDVHIETSPPTEVIADRHQIQQVFMNIILNAIQSLDPGGRLTLSSVYQEDHIQIHIEDNGCGIAEEDMDKIFEPFFTKKPHGVGLGLSVSYQLIKENQGTIDVSSSQGSGTRFTITLPTPQ